MADRLRRRHFLQTAGVAVAWSPAAGQPPTGQIAPLPDSLTNPPGLEYFLLGNGLILAAVQYAAGEQAGSQGGLILMSPDHLNRKTGSLLWTARAGARDTRIVVTVNGRAYSPEPGRAEISWQYPNEIPTVRMIWDAGDLRITEEFYCPVGKAILVRTVSIENRARIAADVRLTAVLRPNPLLFDEYEVDRRRGILTAAGYHRLHLFTLGSAVAGNRELAVTPVDKESVTFVLALDTEVQEVHLDQLHADTARYWRGVARLETGDGMLDHLFRTATHGLRAVVARSGKMDGGTWQYNLEWVRDAVMVASGAVLAGMPEIAEAILDRVLTRMVDEHGAAQDSSSERPPEIIELDQNGAILHALWTHWVWTGSDHLVRAHWARIRAVADYPLDARFRDPRTGLLKNSREFWERGPAYGVREGYESAYQAWNIAGLRLAAEMALHVGEPENAARWQAASAQMQRSFLTDPRFAMVDAGRFLKRRLADGTPHRTMEPPDPTVFAPGMPLGVEPVRDCDPDAASVFPILLGIVDGASDVALKTLASMETLWNQRWEGGGYGRYHVHSEPDSPGPWPFATLFIARAYLEAGDSAKVWRALRWLAGVRGGKSGAWFEFYGPRPSPPLPQVALIPWTWAEIVRLFVHHMLGVRPTPSGVIVQPKWLDGLPFLRARLRLNGHIVRLTITRTADKPSALFNGLPVPVHEGSISLPRPEADCTVEMRIR